MSRDRLCLRLGSSGLDGGTGPRRGNGRRRVNKADAQRGGGQDDNGEAPWPALGSTHVIGAKVPDAPDSGAPCGPSFLGQTRRRSDSRAGGAVATLAADTGESEAGTGAPTADTVPGLSSPPPWRY